MKTYYKYFVAGGGYALLAFSVFVFIIAEVCSEIGYMMIIIVSFCRLALLLQTGGYLTGVCVCVCVCVCVILHMCE